MLFQALLIAAVLYQGTCRAEVASTGRKDAVAFFGYDWWIILGQAGNNNTLNGLTIHINDVETSNDGPKNMTSWEFKGNADSYTRVENPENGGPLTFYNSFTIGTYIYQDYTNNGPIVEWTGPCQGARCGAHFSIWDHLLYMNMGLLWKGAPTVQHGHMAVPTGGWHFVGVSYSDMTGNLTMWVDSIDNVYEQHIGTGRLSCMRDVLIGARPVEKTHNPLKAKLAGLTILNGAINKTQIKEFKCNIVAFVANESLQVSYEDWIPHTDDLFLDCYFEPDELPLPEPLPQTYHCASPSPHRYFGTNWWNILGQDENNPNLNGLHMDIVGVSTTFDGPNGIPAWNFLGSPNSYIRIPNARGGPLDLLGSFTIGTFFYQSELRQGPIFEWRGSSRSKSATQFWIWHDKLYVNLVGTKATLSYPTSVSVNTWHFVGFSFDIDAGSVFIWLDNARNITRRHVGHIEAPGYLPADAFGDVYIGNRGANHSFIPFKGKLAGLTVLDGPIEPNDIEAFKCKILTNVALGLPGPKERESDAGPKILGNNWWILLGQNESSQTLNGVELQVHNVKRSPGPLGLTAWDFVSTLLASRSYIRINNPQHGALNFNASFTIGTFIYHDHRTSNGQGQILKYVGKRYPRQWGVQFGIDLNVLYLNLAPRFGGASVHYHDKAFQKAWRFVGVTFNHDTGILTMWVDGNIYEKQVGRLSPDCRGNIYIGNSFFKGSSRNFQLKGRLAGLTLLKGSIDKSQIKQFKCLIVAVTLKGSYPENWDPTSEDSFGRCILQPDLEPPHINPRNYSCNTSSPNSRNYFGFNWWNVLGQTQVHSNLRGLSLEVFGVKTTGEGPNGIAAWNFKGTGRSYIRIPNPADGHLNLESFTIGTFIYLQEIQDGAIVEWRGKRAGAAYGTNYWVKLFQFLGGPGHFARIDTSFSNRVPLQGWHFIGISYNRTTDKLLRWVDDTVNLKKRARMQYVSPCKGDVYIGRGPRSGSVIPFEGLLAGLTILSGPITENQIEDFKCMILATVQSGTAST